VHWIVSSVRRRGTAAGLSLAGLLLVVEPGAAQEAAGAGAHAGAPEARAVPLRGSVTLDGRLDEEAWRVVPAVTRFTQLDPAEGQPVSERTEVYLLYDEEALYVGARLHDTGPVSRRLARRDAQIEDSDWLIVALDSYHDHLTAYRFSVNPSGVRRDEVFTSGGNRAGSTTASAGVIERGGQADATWDPVWSAAAAVTDSGWVAEMRIPFGQLRFNPGPSQTWGLQVERRIARKQEQALFAFTPKDQPAGVALYGHLLGLEGIQPPRPLEILPYASGRLLSRPAVPRNASVGFSDPFWSRSDLDAGAGADVKYRLTPNLTLDATLNPDFGQVEVDPAVINLTAYETKFDEKRPFFVEGAEILRFGTSVQGNPEGGPPQLVYSRRIGRAPQLGLPADAAYADVPETTTILGAAKLTGRTAEGWSVGLLEAVTQGESGLVMDTAGLRREVVVEPLANYLAGRLKRDFDAGRISVGGLATAVNRRLDGTTGSTFLRSGAYAGGIDFRAETADRVWSVFGSFSASQIRGSAASITAAQRASARYFQRPDARHLELDPEATSLEGYRAQVDVGKRAGTWIWNTAVTATSPGYEINDMGFQLNSDRVMLDPNVTYERNRPGRLFRRWSLRFGPDYDFNYDGNLIRQNTYLNFQSQLLNYWTPSVRYTHIAPILSDRLTRGGPLARLPAGDTYGLGLISDPRRAYSISASWSLTRDRAGMDQTTASLVFGLKPAPNWSVEVGPELNTMFLPAQYVTTVVDPTAAQTFGSRYVFASLDQTTLGIDTRLNVTFTPALSLELYAQPFLSSNDFGALKELSAPRTFDFLEYGRDVGTVTRETGAGSRIDPDGAGPASAFRVDDRDFNLHSLRGNAVLRWEWRPGSTLFLVWQQERAGRMGALDAKSLGREPGTFDLRQDARDLFGTRPVNVLLYKVSYWLNT
jgi:hypothetical protein